VRPKNRTAADEYYHQGNFWIEGREGNDYCIELRNHTTRPAMFVVSVDGLDVLQGQTAGANSPGFIVPAVGVTVVQGWNINNQQAAAFLFTRKSTSYVNQIGGSTTNTGVIGAMVFAEKPPVYTAQETGLRNTLVASSFSGSLGTGFGEALTQKLSQEHFLKATPGQPQAILALYYNTAKNLEKMGIKLRRRRDVSYQADPFPAYQSGCKPPPGWNS
jgi:hypothetical protein